MDKNLDVKSLLEMIKAGQITSEEAFRMYKTRLVADSGSKTNHGLTAANSDPSQAMVFFSSEWLLAPIRPAGDPAPLSTPVIVFDYSERFAKTLGEKAPRSSPVILVTPGESFNKLDNFTFEINIRRPNDYRSLFSELIRRKIIPESLIYLLPFRDESRGRATVDQELDCGFYSLLSMAKGLIEQKTSSPMTILYFYPHEMGLRRALHSAMSGFARTLQIECPRLSCKTVEIKKQDYAKGVTDTDLVRVALTELGPGHREELEVLHAGEKRYLRGLKEMRPSGNEVQSPLKVGGVYLITGGAGGIGRVFAERLAISGRSKLIIAGLSPITDESRAFIRKLESYGAEAVYCQTDLTSRSQVEEMVATARNRFEVIDGVIHCAGVNRNSLLLKKTVEEAAQTLSPKIQGAINLDEALKNEKLDFFVMFSSLVAVKGNIGQADYAYANRFLDCFAEHRNDMARRSQREGKTLSINWPPWEGGGMVVDNRMIEWARKDSGIETLNCEQGIQGFELALSHPGHQIAVAFGDAEKIKHTFGLGQSTLSARSEGTANVSGGRVLKDSGRFRDEVEGFLKDVLSRETKMPVSKMCSTEPFEKYGIDSMMIMSLTHDLEIHFGKLSKTLFFEYQNIAELAEYFINNHADKLIEKIRTGPAESYGESVLGRPVMAIQNCPPPAAEVIDRRSVDGGKIAIIGIAGRYPQARDLDEFWDNLKKGKDCVTEIPAERWNHDLFFDADRDKTDKCYSKWGGFIDDVDKFDPLFFNISPKEAELMDPQERLFLQTVHQAVEDAGYTRSSLSKSKVGVFAGVMYAHYQLIGLEERLKGNAVTPDSFFASIPNRVSYYFNLRGPSIALDTLCSSSLTAIHLACESIRSGECEMAIAGGVNLTLHPNKYLTLSQGKFASTDGRCRSFGEGGDGYVPGEGVGSVLLKPLAKAVLDGDHIYAVIRATAVNHGGKSNGITVPNPQAQSELIKDALKKAGIAPRAVSYLEAHGTGTALGDPIEIRGLTRAFNGAAIKSHSDEKQYCAIGSVKSNIGHLESAAGIAGITKVVLQMRHGRIAPSIHSESLNPHIDFSETPFYVQRELTEWAAPVTRGEREETHHPRIAGVSSFGAGGSNAHVILEEYTDPNGAARSRDHGARLIVLSARTEQQLVQYAEKLCTRISEDCGRLPLADLAYTLQTGREAYDSRLAIVAANCDALAKKLNAFCRGEKSVEDLFVGVVNKERVEREQSEPQGSIGNKDPATLAELWVKGVPIDWEELYAGSDVRRLSLPTYPFAKERCWIARAERPAASLNLKPQAELHPFIDRNTSTLEEQKYSSNFSGGEPLFADHKVGGQIVAPGAVILEMVRAGGELAGSRKVRKVKDVAWTSPIIFPPSKEPIEVNVSFHPNANNVDYEVWTATEGDSRHIHSRGRIIYEDIQRRSEKISLATLYAECAESLTGEQCYERFQKHGLEYGPRFRAIRELRSSDTATVAAIELPQQSDNDLRRFGYVPALIDAALQSTLGLLNRHNLGPETLFAPFSLAEIELLKPLTRSCFAVVKARAGRSRDGSGLKRFDIQIVDEWGEVLVRIEDFSVRAVDTAAFQPYRNPVDKNEVVVLKPAWSEDAASETVSQDAKSSSRVLLVFADALDPVVDKFSGDLDREGIKQCILVRSGDEFKKINSSEYSVRPNVSDDYRKLLSSLGAGGVYPDAILHLWAFSLNGSRNDLTFEIRRGFYSVLYLCQSFAAQKASDSLRIVYAYPDDATNPHPALAAVSALLRCVALEIAGINYKAVALQTESRPYGEFHHILLKEVLADTSWNTELKYKGSKRFQRIWEERLSAKAVKPLRTALRQKGAYLITGGAGSLGLIFAEYLAEAAQARLALVGRSQLSSESLSRIEKMRGRGADVIYIQADISRKNEVTRAVSETKLKFGEINGIIHSAGVIRDSLVVGKTEEQVAAVCGPKMYGAFWLDEATSQDQLDFFILFSSAAGVLGNIGQSDYAFANSYLDNFAFQRESLRSSGRRTGLTVSIDWPLWENGGISVDRATVDWMRENKGLTPLKTAAGIGAMEAVLGAAENQALVLQGDRKRILGALSPQETLIESTSYSTTARAAAPHDPQLLEKVENYLKRLLSVEIRLPPSRIASREPLENYGIDSVMVVNMTRQLEKDFGELSKTLFFEFNTIHNLARYFVESHGRGVAEKFGGKTLLDGNKCRDAGVAVASEIRPRFASLKNGRTEVSVSNDIAIIGVSGRYPMADNLDQFWEILKSGRDCVTEIPAERWDHRRICDQNRKGPGSGISEWGGFIDNVDKFDPLFFNISPREAKLMDPQERLFLETVWHTVEDAGYTRADLGNQRVGVFVGAMYAQYQLFSLEPPYKHNGLTPSSLNASIANRISYVFNLRGPSIGLDTMCSSSLTAIHLACSSIRQHECEMAIAGGVNLSLHPNKYLALGQGKFTSSDGRCRSFGEGGDGYVPGEGVGAVLLKPLHLAIADGDHIYAVIKGSAINHGGKTNGYTVPSPVAQSEVVAEALKKAGIDSRRIGYVEAHGTGTSLGDPIEITGLLKAFEAAGGTGDSSDRRKIPIGSVKSNIGHLESAAGIASLTKVILQMKYGQLAPSLHAEQPNPNIDFDRTPFYVQRELTAWDRPTLRENGEERPCPRQAGISSFGAGGSNAHIIIEEYLGPKVSITDAEPQDQVFVLSARNEERLKVYTENIRAFLGGTCGETPAPARREDRLEQVQNPLLQIASEALGISSSEIGLDESLSDYGFDPVSIARLEDLISRRFDIEFTGPPPSGPITLRHYALNVVDATDRPPLEPSESELNPADLAYTLQVGREAMEERVAIVASSVAELRDKLQRYIKGEREIDGVYMGNARRNGLAPAMFLEGKEGEEFFRAIVRERKWGKVAQLWVMGGEVDWRLLHTDSEPRRPARRRLSLPVYPFARERQWLPESAPGAAEIQTSIHPLLDRLDARLSLCEPHGVVFRKTLTNRDPIIRDHVVLDRGILPGVGYLEMARAAIAEVGGQRNFRLRNVALVQPLVVTGATDTQVIIREENNRTLFEIRSATDSSAAHLVHARGECEWETPSGPERRLSIDEIKARCAEVIEKQDLYSQFDAVGIRYGSYYRRVERLWGGDKESLGLLTLPSENKDELRQYALHPAMMDGALQVVAGIAANRSERSGLALPFAIEAVDVMSSLSNRLYAHARMIDIDRYHVDVIDEDGRLCAALRDVRLRQVKRRNEPSNFFYFPSWRRAPSVAGQLGFRTEKAHAGVILVFEPRGGSELEGVLSSALQASRVVRVSLGETTKQLSNDHWRVDTSIPRELDLWLGQIENITGIYFLSGINPERSEPTDTVSLEKSQEDGVISLFRIIKSLDRLGYGARPIEIKVVTDRACQIFEGEFIQPHGASLSGFVKSAAKEYPKWGFSNIDIDLPQYLGPDDDQISNITELIISEPSDSWGNEVAIRGAHRYTRGLLPIDLPAVKQIPFRHQGVYLILGGAGGIGLEFSRFLAEKFLAKLVLIGRGELNAVQKNSLRRIEEVGGEVLYLRADAVDEEGIRIAVQQAKARFSRINGVIHSAIVLKDKTITNMDESVFRASLDPKVKGSVNLYRAIKGEKLDFMLFFSSAQSFSGNAGQSNYSAACSFKDAFANYVGGREQFPVKVINWGYWGEVGVVSSDEYNRRLAAQGIGSIRAEEGINAVTRLLSHQLRQILAIKAEKTLLLPIGLDLNAQAAHVTQSNPSFFSEVVSRTGRASSGAAELLGLKRQFEDVASLGRLLLLDSFQSMGVFTGKGESYCMEKLISRLSIRPRFKRLFDSLLGMLAHAEFISVNGHELRTTSKVESEDVRRGLADLPGVKERLSATYPELTPHLNLLWTCVENLPPILREEVAATDVIFPNSSMGLVEGIYQGNPITDLCNIVIAEAVKAYLHARLPQLEPGERIRIIEIGAGTGGASSRIFDSIRNDSEFVAYDYTDVSVGFIRYGRARYGSLNPFVDFKVLDIEQDVARQEVTPGGYDLVIAANVLHATNDLRGALQNVKSLLKANGCLILNEITEIQDFTTLTFGLLDGWWRYTDADLRLKGSPLLSSTMWETLLREEGFKQARCLEGHGRKGHSLGQSVIIAESDGIVIHRESASGTGRIKEESMRSRAVELPPSKPRLTPDVQSKLALPSLKDAGNYTPATPEFIRNKIIACVSAALTMDKAEIDPERQFSEYGVDSIIGVDLINSINDSLGITLRTTALFDYGSVKEMARYIHSEFAAQITEDRRGVEKEQTQPAGGPVNQPPFSNLDLLEKLAEGSLTTQQVVQLIGV